MSPFDSARYERLLGGLEACEISFREVMLGTATARIDPEYFNRAALHALSLIKGGLKLGDLVADGYRVVYETTQAIDRLEGEANGLPYFLQAADISTPFINAETMGCVDKTDWERYPKGRVIPGELLIEVKGKAEKIALVPDDFPPNTLITGTCFKLTTKKKDDQYFLAAYLTCGYGQLLKDRLKSNLLVSYLAKDDLYSLPVPVVSDGLKAGVRSAIEACFERKRQADLLLKDAETSLLRSLNVEDWASPEPLSYVHNSRDAFASGRLDAEFFTPRVRRLLDRLGSDGLAIADLAPPRRERFTPGDIGTFHYIEIGGLRSEGTAEADEVPAPEAPSRATQIVRAGDVITSTVRPIRRLTAVVGPEQDGFVCSSGFVVLQPREIAPEVLLTYLRLKPVCELMDLYASASLYPAISERDLVSLPIPAISPQVQIEIKASVLAARQAKQRAMQLLDAAKRAVEIAIEDSESAALTYLEGFTAGLD